MKIVSKRAPGARILDDIEHLQRALNQLRGQDLVPRGLYRFSSFEAADRMDDEPDRAYSRAPELQDLVDLCRALGEEGVRYLLIGGFAVVLHGFVRTTKDIDLLVDPADDNVAAIKKALGTLPDDAVSQVEDGDVRRYSVVRVADEIVVDLMASACGITYEDAIREDTEERVVDDVVIPLAGKRLLIRMKDTVRDSDRMDVRFLRLRIDDEGATED